MNQNLGRYQSEKQAAFLCFKMGTHIQCIEIASHWVSAQKKVLYGTPLKT